MLTLMTCHRINLDSNPLTSDVVAWIEGIEATFSCTLDRCDITSNVESVFHRGIVAIIMNSFTMVTFNGIVIQE